MEWRWNGDGLEMELGVELELGNFNVSRSPFGLDFGTLDLGLTKKRLLRQLSTLILLSE